MKKYQLFLIGILILTLILAVGIPQTGAAKKERLEFVFWLTSPEALPGWQKTFSDFAKENPNIELVYTPVEADTWGVYVDKVATLIAGGKAPDVMWVATEGVRLLAERKLARPIDDLVKRDSKELKEYFDDVAPSLIDSFKVKGKLYQLPYSWNNMVIYYNPKLLEKAGLQPPKADWTKDDFLNYAKALTVVKDGKTIQYGFATEVGYFTSSIPWMFANNTNLLKDDWTASNLDDPKVVEAVQFVQDLIYKYKVCPAPAAGFNIFNAFMSGNVAMFGAGRWPLMTFLPEKFKDFNIQVWPKWKTQVTEFGVDGFPILSSSKNVSASWKLVKYMTSKSVLDRLVGSEDAPLGNIPARRSLATGTEMAKIPPANFQAFYGSLSNAKSVPAPAQFNKVESIWLRYYGLILANEMSAAEGCAKAHQEINKILGK